MNALLYQIALRDRRSALLLRDMQVPVRCRDAPEDVWGCRNEVNKLSVNHLSNNGVDQPV